MDTPLAVVESFNLAFNRHDLDAVMALMTEDCIFENTYPAPDGTRHSGQSAVRQAFADFFQSSPHATFVAEDVFAAEDRCVVRWRYQWNAAPGQQDHVRGVDVFRIRDDKVAEKLSYVKG
jgi:ketosteroid isomerase-like protein